MELNEFIEKQIQDHKKFFLVAFIILFLTVLIDYLEYKFTNFVPYAIYAILNTLSILSIICIIPFFPNYNSFIKLKNDEEYKKIIAGNCKKIFPDLLELYFTDEYIMDISNLLLKYNYIKVKFSDIAIVDIKQGYCRPSIKKYYISIIDKNLNRINIMNYNKYISKTKAIEVLEEIKRNVPNVLIGDNAENINKVKSYLNK